MQDGKTPDGQLLEAHVHRRDEDAFAQLVRRHVNLVFGTALRILGDRSAAEEVAQNVFVTLARKAASIRAGEGLAGWLHRAAVLEARMRQRTDLRRRNREEAAARLGTTMDTTEPTDPLPFGILDDALLELPEKDRQALFLRYFECRPFREIGRSLGMGEDAAQKRASRALEALAAVLRRRGAATATATLAARTLEAAALTSAPVHLASTIAAATVGASSSALGILLAKLMAYSKTQTTVACLLLASAPVGYQWHVAAGMRRAEAEAARRLIVTTEALRLAEKDELITRRRLGALSERLAETRSQIRRAADTLATAAAAPDASLYLWSDTATHVRVPKSVAPSLRLSGSVQVPALPGGVPYRRSIEPVGADGSLAEPLAEALGVTPSEDEDIRRAFGRTQAVLREKMHGAAYLTNRSPAQFRAEGKPSLTLVTPALPDVGVSLGEQLRSDLDRILGAERAELVWQQAAETFDKEFFWFGRGERLQTAVSDGPGHLTLWTASRDPGGEITAYTSVGGRLGIEIFPAPLRPTVAGWLANSQTQRQ